LLIDIENSEKLLKPFDDPLVVNFFENDPRGFMEKYENKVIFDEVQKSPEIFHFLGHFH